MLLRTVLNHLYTPNFWDRYGDQGHQKRVGGGVPKMRLSVRDATRKPLIQLWKQNAQLEILRIIKFHLLINDLEVRHA